MSHGKAIYWRQSVTDLATDIAAALTVGELRDLMSALAEKRGHQHKYDPHVKAAIREHFEFALPRADTAGPHFVIGVLMGAGDVPKETQEKFLTAFTVYHGTVLGRVLP